MLDPYDRLQLVNELRPPDGFEFDCGIGTTFSLDLESLMTVPLSLALCEFESRDDALANPEAVLEGLRRITGKLHVFCHRGRIKRPREGMLLSSLLEDIVVQVLPKNRAGVFHPKVWVLRYRRGDEAMIRVLVLSRNLTFDKSWDTALVLDGEVQQDRPSAVRQSSRLAQFLRALEELSGDLAGRVKVPLESLAKDISQVEFENPEGFKDFTFWPLGIETAVPNILNREHSRLMVISPFVSDLTAKRSKGVLDQLLYKRTSVEQNVLVSRADQLDALPPASIAELQATTRIYALDDAAAHADQTAETAADVPIERPVDSLSGLHAKVYVIEDGANVSVVTGSANATAAAWGRGGDTANVEFIVELHGARRTKGINALLGEEESAESAAGGLLRILKPYRPPSQAVEVDHDAERVERMIDDSRRILAEALLRIDICPEGDDKYCATLTVPPLGFPEGVECQAWPIMLPQGRAQSLAAGKKRSAVEFSALTIYALTPFWAFRLQAKVGKAEQTVDFVLRLPVEGMPDGRNAAIMTKMIDSSERFLRYLALLLADAPSAPGVGLLGGRARVPWGTNNNATPMDTPMLLENLVRAFSRNPKRLERIDALLEDLKKGTPTANVIPAGFEDIWQAFRPVKK